MLLYITELKTNFMSCELALNKVTRRIVKVNSQKIPTKSPRTCDLNQVKESVISSDHTALYFLHLHSSQSSRWWWRWIWFPITELSSKKKRILRKTIINFCFDQWRIQHFLKCTWRNLHRRILKIKPNTKKTCKTR